MVILLIAGGGGTFTPITTTQIETNRPGKFGNNAIHTNNSTYYTYELTEALGTEDFTLSYWAKFDYGSVYANENKRSISIGQYNGTIGHDNGHLEPNSTVCIATNYAAHGAYYDFYWFDVLRYYGQNDGKTYSTKFSNIFSKNEQKEWHHHAIIRYGEYFLVFCDGKLGGGGDIY